jgi:hypothetical protein
MSRAVNDLHHGSKVALAPGMNVFITRALLLLLVLLAPSSALASVTARQEACAKPATTEQDRPPNVNTRYGVESATVTGVEQSAVSPALRDDIQKLVGNKYDPEAAECLAERLRKELWRYDITLKVKRGEQPERVKVIFEAERLRTQPFEIRVSPILYTSHDALSLAIVPAVLTHDNYVSFGYITNANDLLERNEGLMFRYEHRKVGTSAVQVGLEYDYFHPSFQPETETALAAAPLVPGIYRTREVFAPSLSLLPVPDVKATFGVTLETLEMQYPVSHDQAANAVTVGLQYRKEVRPRRGLRHTIGADYSLRNAVTGLESDFLYTRQWVAGDYTLAVGQQEFGFHFQGGHASGAAPLYERFSIGSATTLRGWDKFDVAPVGGSRLLYGSLEYRYRPLELFYDFGTVWDPGRAADWRYSVGVGLAWKNGFFMSIGVPLRFHSVTPAVVFGFRPLGRG